jgi:hypothetical protein
VATKRNKTTELTATVYKERKKERRRKDQRNIRGNTAYLTDRIDPKIKTDNKTP